MLEIGMRRMESRYLKVPSSHAKIVNEVLNYYVSQIACIFMAFPSQFILYTRNRQRRRKVGSNRGLQRSANGIPRLPNLHNNCVYGSLLCYVGPAQAKSGKLLQGFRLAFVAICLIVVLLCRSFFRFLGRLGQTKSLRLWEEEGGGHDGVADAACIVRVLLCVFDDRVLLFVCVYRRRWWLIRIRHCNFLY